MLSEDLPIYKATFDLIKQMYVYQNNVPKQLRYGEYGKAQSMAFQALDLIYCANSNIQMRSNYLTKYLQLMGGVRSRLKLFSEIRALPIKQVTYLLRLVDGVTKQAIGWRNKIR